MSLHRPLLVLGLLATGLVYAGQAQQAPASSYRTWAAYGGGPEQLRYSSLQQINRSNVATLQVAWSFDTKETGGLQTQPIVVDGVLYAYTPTHKAIAIDAASGTLLWTFDSKIV